MIIRTILFVYLFILSSSLQAAREQFAQDRPVVIWASSPVQPGETVLIHGGNFGKNPVIELTANGKKQAVTPISVSEASIMFIYPKTWEYEIIRGVVKSGELISKSFQLNAPDVWWVHGDRGQEASVIHGTLRLIGNCLADTGGKAPIVKLQNVEDGKQGKSFLLNVLKYNRFSIQTTNWKEIPSGTYEVFLIQDENGLPYIVGKIRISGKKNEYPKEIFNVVDFGAIPNDGIDDTPAIIKAMERLKENRGGELFFPIGRFQMTRTIELPPYSILRGMGADHTQIYWPDTYEPLDALIKGTHSFEVSNIFLTCGNHRDGIVGNWPELRNPIVQQEKETYKCGNISIVNVTMRMLYSQFINNNLDEMKRRISSLHGVRALRLGGENINVTGNNIYCAAGGVFEFQVYWSNISNNVFSRGNIIGWNGFAGQQSIFADNHLGGANCTSFYALREGSENIYWGNNYQENTFDGNNRETITGDLRVIVYLNSVKNITPTSFTTQIGLKGRWVTPSIFNTEGKVNSSIGAIDNWRNGAVQITSGKGLGQIRRIKSIDGTKIDLESAWDIVPDETSILTISSFRRRLIYTENRTYDSSIALQFYGSMIEAIVANNVTSRTGGYSGDTNRDMPNWFNQFFDNTIESGIAYRGPRNQVPAIDAHLGLLGAGSEYPVVRSCVIRNNKLISNAKLDLIGNIADCLLEKNSIANSNTGIAIDNDAQNIVLSKNIFHGVNKPYEYSPKSVVIQPAEELWSAMDGVFALMGWKSYEDMPVEWREIRANNELLNATSDQIIDIWEKVVKTFAEQNENKLISDKVAEMLLGIQIQVQNWQTMYSIIHEGKAGVGSLLINIPDSRVRAQLKLSVRSKDFPIDGWRFSFSEIGLVPGESAILNATIDKSEGKVSMLKIPLKAEVSGIGWKLNFTTIINDIQDKIILNKFKISHPLDNPLGKQSELGYMKYMDIPKPMESQLFDPSTKSGSFDFVALYSDKANEGKIIYGTTTIKAKSLVNVKFQFSNNCLFFVNGKIVGTTLPKGQWGFVSLREGENKVELLMLPSIKNEWCVEQPYIIWSEKADSFCN